MSAAIPFLAIALGAFAAPALAQTPDWILESPATSPAERVGYINVTSDGSQMYVFGGKTSAGYQNDLWAYDGTNWSLLDDGTVSAPEPVVNHALAWDASRQVLVFFGAKHKNSSGALVYRDETWEWTATTGWQQITPAGSIPPARGFHTLIYYPEAGGCVLFSGREPATTLGDTWIWDGTTWTEVTGIASPPPRYDGGAVYRSAPHNDMIYVGGRGSLGSETWQFVSDGATHSWTQLGAFPDQIDNQGMYYDPRRDVVVVHGGQIGSPRVVTNQTFEFDGSTWAEVFPLTLPIVRKGQAMTWLESLGQGVMFGGTTDAANQPPAGTPGWNALLTNETWSRGSGAPGTPFCPGDGITPHTLCPCANNNNGSMGGCDWGDLAFPEGGVLTATGSDSMAANDTLLLATGVSNNFGIFFGANNQVNSGNGNPLNDGLRCAGGGLVRLISPTMATGNAMTLPQPVQTLDTGAAAGATRRYQYWFRTPSGPCGQMANLTNGFEIAWLP